MGSDYSVSSLDPDSDALNNGHMGHLEIVPAELKALFIEVVTQSADAFFRKEMESRGLKTLEEREPSPNARLAALGGFVETRPKIDRVKGYFDALDWSDRDKVKKIMAVVNLHMRKIDPYMPPGFYDNVMRTLDRHGLKFDGNRILAK